MFTGIIEETGKVQTISDSKIEISAHQVLEDAKIGDSICVNGVCLTVSDIGKDYFKADISPETKQVTTIGNLKNNSIVNLERALPANGRFGGHIVSGHVDSIGVITKLSKTGNFYDLEIKLDSDCTKYIAQKGSIAVNGISLTVADILDNKIKAAIIPHTFENTCLKELHTGDFVNIETDILAKYVEKFLSTSDNRTVIDMEFLEKHGF